MRTFPVVLTAAALVGTALIGVPATAAPATPVEACELPAAGEPFETVQPSDVDMDAKHLQRATTFATSRARSNVQVFRHNCLVGEGALNQLTNAAPHELWSSTKSIVSLAAGAAIDRGLLELDDPIGKYLPKGWGDEAHRAITVRQLLQQNSGLKTSILSEAGTTGTDVNVVRQAMALPLEHKPGTWFEYGQRNPDVVAYVVGRAAGMDVQEFTQRAIFDPIGIQRGSYQWLRDRAGNTYGYAHMFMRPADYARIGLLLTNDGTWNNKRVISSEYLDQARTPSKTNPCYGMLFWTNHAPCTSPDVPARRTTDQPPLPIFGENAFAMVGFLQQNNFVDPDLDTLVSWTGFAGDLSPDPQTFMSANPNSELYWEFFRKLGPAYADADLPRLGPYEHAVSLKVTPGTVADPEVLLGGLGAGRYGPEGCTPLGCADEN